MRVILSKAKDVGETDTQSGIGHCRVPHPSQLDRERWEATTARIHISAES
jgi:hypothetical protein